MNGSVILWYHRVPASPCVASTRKCGSAPWTQARSSERPRAPGLTLS